MNYIMKERTKEKDETKMKCYVCGGDVEFQGDTIASELFDTRADDNTEVRFYTCKECGRIYEVVGGKGCKF